jgi:hypothetical protein
MMPCCYTWEAETAGGEILTRGPGTDGRLADCVRISFLPGPGVPLPRHDLILPGGLIRRFARKFIKTHFNTRETLPGVIYWNDGERVQKTSDDLRQLLKPGDYVGKGVAKEDFFMVHRITAAAIVLVSPYKGHSKPQGFRGKKVSQDTSRQTRHELQCVVCDGFRWWLNTSNGAVTLTPQDQEVHL